MSTCQPWADEGDLCSPCDDYEALGPVAAEWMQAASDALYVLSGRQFPGLCERTVRPCAPADHAPNRDSVPVGGMRSSGACRCYGACQCPGLMRVGLGAYPVAEVSEVLVDGVVVDPGLYRVDEYRYLVRLRDADGRRRRWPATQHMDLPDTEVGTWSVTFTWGREPPTLGTRAAAALACDLALACQPENAGQCRLPKKVQSVARQGVQIVMTDLATLLSEDRTGVPEVDLFIKTYNPKGLRRAGSVWAPGMGRAPRADT